MGHFHSPKMLHDASEISKSPVSRLLVVLPQPRGLGANFPRSCGCLVVILPRARGCLVFRTPPRPRPWCVVVVCDAPWRRSVCSCACACVRACVCVCVCLPARDQLRGRFGGGVFMRGSECTHRWKQHPPGGGRWRPPAIAWAIEAALMGALITRPSSPHTAGQRG